MRKAFYLFSALFLAGLLACSPILLADHQEEFNKTLPLKFTGSFSLKNVNGSIILRTWKEEKVEIHALKSTKSDPENLAKVKIEIEASPEAIIVNTVYPKMRNIRIKVEYEVKVPEGVNLPNVSSVNGRVQITGPLGRVIASTTNGDVVLEQASGNLSLSTTNGQIEARNVKGKIDAHTVNGSIELTLASLEDRVDAETVNGSIDFRPGPSGELNAALRAKTVNGHISVDFPLTLQNLEKSRHKLEGKLGQGQGGPEINLETVNGSIRLIK